MKKALLLLACGAFMMSANATTVVEVTFDSNSTWSDYTATQGWWQMMNQDSEWACSVSTYYDPRNEGSFVMSDLDLDYTLLIGAAGEIVYDDVTATVTNNAGVITCVANFVVNATDTEYKVTMVYDPSAPTPMQYDQNSDADMHFELEDISSCEYDAEYEDVWFVATNADKETIVLDFTVEGPDAETVLPAGEYPVDPNYGYNTLAASVGVQSGSVYPSFLGLRNEEGLLTTLWFVEAGSATVKKVVVDGNPQLYIELNATNSYGKTVHATVGSDPSAVSLNKVEAPVAKIAKKSFIDGKVVIRNNEKQLNVVGAEM